MHPKTIIYSIILMSCLASRASGVPDDPANTAFLYDFSERGETAFALDWKVTDANGDGMTWQYSPWTAGIDGKDGAAVCYGAMGGDLTNDDYLVSPAVMLTEGVNHVSFYVRGGYGEASELIEVLCSNGSEDMEVVGSVEFSGPDWRAQIFNFSVHNKGEYYIAFRNCSVEGAMTCIDNVAIGQGALQTSPDLSITRLLLPVSNCDLSAESRIGAILRNTGTQEADCYTLTCSINQGQQLIDETFGEVIAPNESKAVYFTQKADFADIGDYEVVIGGCCEGKEIEACAGEVSALTPEPLPFSTDFSDGSLGDWAELSPGSWTFDDFGGYMQAEPGGISKALVSRCFEAQRVVRVRISYGTSIWGEGKMHIAAGKAGCDPAFFRTVYEDPGFSGTKEAEFEFEVPEADHYCLLIVNDDEDEWGEQLMVRDITVSEVKDYDVAITDVNGCLSPFTPIGQLTAATPIQVTVANRGLKEFSGLRITASIDGEQIGTNTLDRSLAKGESVQIEVCLDLSSAAVYDIIRMSVVADGNEIDECPTDNTLPLGPVNVTEKLRANENITDLDLGVGLWGDTLSIGNVYTLACDDVLTGLEIGFTGTDEVIMHEKEVEVSVYEVNDDATLGRKLFSQKIKRGAGGFVGLSLDPMLLHQGSYYFEVAQLSVSNMGLAYTLAEGNTCYQNIDGRLTRINNDIALAIRTIFDEAFAPAHDVAPIAIISPAKAQGLYSSEQVISALVKNLGYEDADVSVSCQVNGQQCSSHQLHLQAYETAVCDFGPYDMGVPGDYSVEVVTSLQHDQAQDNDRVSATFTAVREQNPYVMDFEYCDDFDSGDETFNPRWRTFDRNGGETDGFWQYSYPHHSASTGFIAFNPDNTVPSMSATGFRGFKPHGGERFGAAFAAVHDFSNPVEHSDVWLVSPKLQLMDGSDLEFYVKTRELEWEGQPLERYQVLVSETDDDPESFALIGPEVREAPAEDWEKVTVDLSEFDNKAVHVAIRYIGRPGENVVLMIDDITVNTNLSATGAFESGKIDITVDGQKIIVTAPTEIARLTIHDVYGRTMFSAHPMQTRHEINTKGFCAGLYIISATTQSGQVVTKLGL